MAGYRQFSWETLDTLWKAYPNNDPDDAGIDVPYVIALTTVSLRGNVFEVLDGIMMFGQTGFSHKANSNWLKYVAAWSGARHGDIAVNSIFYTVTFDKNDGTADKPTVEVRHGDTAAKPDDPVRTGFNFIGWFMGSEVFDFNTAITDNTTLIAQWEALEWITTIVAPNCTLEGYTELHHVPTGGKWYSNYVPALGHIHDDPVWDGWGWYIVCEVCGWAGYISYDPNEFDDETATIVIFENLKGMQVEYYTNVAGWKTVGIFDDSCTLAIPEEDLATNGATTIRVRNAGMSHVFTINGQLPEKLVVPVKAIMVIGVASEGTLAVVQSDWVYRHSTAEVGVPNYFYVIDNDKKYEVQVGRNGYHSLKIPGIEAGDTVYLDLFYNIAIPEGVSNIRISNANWVDTTVWFANYLGSDVITLFKNNTGATLRFDCAGNNYTVNFTLDGSNPFDGEI